MIPSAGGVRHGWTDWTVEKVELICDRWVAGDSAGVIAKRLGLTRNQIIGKLKRMGYSRNGASSVITVRYPEGRKSAPATRMYPPKPKAPPRPPKRALKAIAEPPKVAGSNVVAFMFSDRHQCAWCVEPEKSPAHAMMMVCGDPKAEGSSWCEVHRRKAMSTTEQRKAVAREARTIKPKAMTAWA